MLVLALAVPIPGAAQTVEPETDVAVGQLPLIDVLHPDGGPDVRDRWQLELTGRFFLEVWDLNLY